MPKVIDKECGIRDGKLFIVVEGANPEEVTGPNARELAIKKAATCGYQRVGVNNQTGSYPVDEDGKTPPDDQVNEWARSGKIVAYRNGIYLMGGL